MRHEAVAFEHRDGAVVHERPRDLATRGILRIALDGAAAEPGDLRERTGEGRGRDTPATTGLVDEEAGDPPVGQRGHPRAVGAAVLDARQLVGRSELAPAHAQVAVVDEGRVSTTFADPALLLGPILRRRLVLADTLLSTASESRR